MDLEAIRKFALSLPHATEDVKWDFDLSFCVGAKMFLVTDIREGKWATIKVKPEEFDELCEVPGIEPSPYLARYKWISVDTDSVWSPAEFEFYIRQSYEMIWDKLPKKVRDLLI
jgi:predicted DNA-binding protein (MmcQ/YjbR family)